MKGARGMSSFYPVNMGVRQGYVFAPSFFNTCVDRIMDRAVYQSHRGSFIGKSWVTDLAFAESSVVDSRGTAR